MGPTLSTYQQRNTGSRLTQPAQFNYDSRAPPPPHHHHYHHGLHQSPARVRLCFPSCGRHFHPQLLSDDKGQHWSIIVVRKIIELFDNRLEAPGRSMESRIQQCTATSSLSSIVIRWGRYLVNIRSRLVDESREPTKISSNICPCSWSWRFSLELSFPNTLPVRNNSNIFLSTQLSSPPSCRGCLAGRTVHLCPGLLHWKP